MHATHLDGNTTSERVAGSFRHLELILESSSADIFNSLFHIHSVVDRNKRNTIQRTMMVNRRVRTSATRIQRARFQRVYRLTRRVVFRTFFAGSFPDFFFFFWTTRYSFARPEVPWIRILNTKIRKTVRRNKSPM